MFLKEMVMFHVTHTFAADRTHPSEP